MNRYVVHGQAPRLRYLSDATRALVSRDFKLRYKRSLFGIAWSMMVPLAQFAVLYTVFNRIVPLNIPRFTTFLLSGILPWSWLHASLMMSATTVLDNRDLVRQASFPVGMLPWVTVLSQMIHFLLALPILAAFVVYDGYRIGPTLAAMPLVILVQLLLTLSIAYFVATLQVKFRDTQYLLGIALFLFFYLTPIFWDDSNIPEPYRAMMRFNPVAVILNAYRSILIRQEWPDPLPVAAVALGAAFLLLMSYTLFSAVRNRFVEEL